MLTDRGAQAERRLLYTRVLPLQALIKNKNIIFLYKKIQKGLVAGIQEGLPNI
jgi:hypothetical protein